MIDPRSSPIYLLFAVGLGACATNDRHEELFGPDTGLEEDDDLGAEPVRRDGGDAGVGRDRDGGRERPMEPPEPNGCRGASGFEGCQCTSTATAVSLPFRREDCREDLLCVPWDLLSGLVIGRELEDDAKTCVKPCNTDAECGANRFCRSLGFSPETGAASVCVDRIAGFDELCSGSRMVYEVIIDPIVQDGTDEITACEDGLTCQFFQFGASFNPDESLCMAFCESDADCAKFNGLNYCNPRAFASSSTTSPYIGVCTDGKHPNGAICGSADPDKIFRVSTGCDTSEETCGANRDGCPLCVSISLDANQSLTPEGQGICMSACRDPTNPCAGGRTCVPQFFANGDGVCSDVCTPVPETCAGAGSLQQGQDCLELAGNVSFCVDRYAPPLRPATWDYAGMLTSTGDNCIGELDNYSFFRCPEGATCVPTPDQGLCVYGCTPGDPSNGATLCRSLLGSATATCTQPQMGFGICGDN